jgi:phosphate transport system substrate-binding protein
MFKHNSANTPWRRSLLWVATAPLLVATALVVERDAVLLAQSPNPLEGIAIPTSIEPGSRLSIQSSESMRLVNEALRSRFSSQYGNADVAVNYESSDEALQALIDGDTDLAAIGRNLTDAESSAGLRELGVSRSKIAILVSPNNPFAGSLTTEQFAQIFRGEITNWSEVGGQDAPIVLVDHPADSDTRQAFRNYPVFAQAPFEPAAGAVTLNQASADDIADALDDNSISYLVAEQALESPAFKIVPMHETLPDDQRYPFSQPLAYVYNPETANPATLAFLGFAVNPDNEALIQAAQAATTAQPNAELAPVVEATPDTDLDNAAVDVIPVAPVAPPQRLPWWPWLLALPVLGGLLWWLLKGAAPVAAPLVAGRDRRIILTPRNCRDAYAYWELPEAEVNALRRQNYSLALKLHDVTDIADVDSQAPHNTYQFDCDTVSVGDLHLPIAVDNRDYLVELGYGDTDNTWHALARSAHVRVPACPSIVGQGNPGVGAAAAAAAGLGAVGLGAAAIARPNETAAPARIVLTPRDCKNAYAYWELPQTTVDELKTSGGTIKARLYDVTELPNHSRNLNSLREFDATFANPGDLHLPIAVDDRDYLIEIGYVNSNHQWQALAKSGPVRVPACPLGGVATAAAAAPDIRQGQPLTGVAGLADRMSAQTTDLTTGATRLANTALTGSAAAVALTGLGTATVALGNRPADTTNGANNGAVNGAAQTAAGVGRRSDLGVESKIILVPRAADAAYAYWEAAPAHKEALQRQGGRVLALRIHDATNLQLDDQPPHATQEYLLPAGAQDRHVPILTPDRDYVAELGYLTDNGNWLQLVRSLHVRVPAA